MLLDNFRKLKAENPNGFTMDRFGHKVCPTEGYAIGIGSLQESDLRRHSALEGQNIGFWKDSKDGTEYIDIVVIHPNLNVALGIGRIFNQKAIWDFANGEEIIL